MWDLVGTRVSSTIFSTTWCANLPYITSKHYINEIVCQLSESMCELGRIVS